MDKFYPDFEGEDCYLYLENKSVFFVYDSDRKLLMVLSAVRTPLLMESCFTKLNFHQMLNALGEFAGR